MAETKSEWKLPKNVRQIGESGSARKIYVEDYVVTFLEGLAREESPKRAILLGETKEWEGIDYLFVSGALELEAFILEEKEKEELISRMNEYFGESRIMGWFLPSRQDQEQMSAESLEFFKQEFLQEDQILMIRDAEEGENIFYCMESAQLTRQEGYYIYYEKNTPMQEYMVSRGAGKSVDQEEPVKDDAIRRFRKIIKEKTARKEQREAEKKRIFQMPSVGKLSYLAGGVLTVTVLALGVTMVYNYDKMKQVERSLARLTNNIDSQSMYLEEDGGAAQVMLHIEEEAQLQGERLDGEEQTEAADTVQQIREIDSAAYDQNISGETAGTEETGASSEGETGFGQASQEQAQTESAGQSDGTEMPASTTPGRASYTVKMGDTIAGISEMYYGSLEKIEEICSLNGIDDENTILPGQKILLP